MANFAYIRTSCKTQNIETQKQEIINFGYNIDYWYVDEGISGKICAKMREEFAKMLQFIRDGETIVVAKLDRLGRDAIDILNIVNEFNNRNIKLEIVGLGSLDTTTDEGQIKLKMLSFMAEMERSLIIERTQAGLARARAEGKQLGRRSKTTDEQKVEIAHKLLNGNSVSSLARQYEVSRATIVSIRKNTNVVVEDV